MVGDLSLVLRASARADGAAGAADAGGKPLQVPIPSPRLLGAQLCGLVVATLDASAARMAASLRSTRSGGTGETPLPDA